MPNRMSTLEALAIVLCSFVIMFLAFQFHETKMQFENRLKETSDVVAVLKQEVISLNASKTYFESQLKESSDAVVTLKKELHLLNETNMHLENSLKETTNMVTTLRKDVDLLNEDKKNFDNRVNETPDTVTSLQTEVEFLITVKPADCTHLKSHRYKTGVYTIHPAGTEGVQVYCDMDTLDKGWTVIQRRYKGDVDFYRNWVDYKYGFGNVNGEYWLGNKYIHQLTSQGKYILRIVMEDFENNIRFAEYSTFYLESEINGYRLRVSDYQGDAGDSLERHNGQMFSTKDKDNDVYTGNCAQSYKGGWWYEKCHYSNLNGLYLNGKTTKYAEGMVWYHWKEYYYSLRTSTLMIRRI